MVRHCPWNDLAKAEQCQQIRNASERNASRQRAELAKTLLENMGASKVADTSAYERAGHLDRAAAEQKDEGATSTGRRKTLLPESVIGLRALNGLEHLVVLMHGKPAPINLDFL